MGGMAPMIDGLAPFGARAVDGWAADGSADGRAGSGRPATPAATLDPRHRPHAPASAGLGVVLVGSAAPSSPSTCWRESWLSIAHFSRAGLISMPRRSSRSSARIAADVAQRLALDLVGQERLALAWLIAQPRPGEPDPVDDAVGHPEHQRDAVAAQRVGALVGRVGILDDPEVMGSPVVLEDVVAVEIVHRSVSVRVRLGQPLKTRWTSSRPATSASMSARVV